MKVWNAKTLEPTDKHQQFRLDMIGVLRKYPDLPAVELMCVTAQFLGQLIALQDQTKYSNEAIMKMVGTNIENGNKTAISTIFGGHGGNA